MTCTLKTPRVSLTQAQTVLGKALEDMDGALPLSHTEPGQTYGEGGEGARIRLRQNGKKHSAHVPEARSGMLGAPGGPGAGRRLDALREQRC